MSHLTEAEQFAAATKVKASDYAFGYVYWEGGPGNVNGDHYWSSVDAVRDFCKGTEAPGPEYVWGCMPESLSIDALSCIESACEDLAENAYESITKDQIETLQKLLNGWCSTIDTHTFMVDESVAVIL